MRQFFCLYRLFQIILLGEKILIRKKMSLCFILVLLIWPDELTLAYFSFNQPTTKPGFKVIKTLKVVITGYYTPSRNQPDYATGSYEGDKRRNCPNGVTASGTLPEIGIVATDNSVIPRGSLIKIIDGPTIISNLSAKKHLISKDTGGDIVGNKVDVYTGKGYQALKKALAISNVKVKIQVVKKIKIQSHSTKKTFLWG